MSLKRCGVNLTNTSYFACSHPYLNWWKTGSPIFITVGGVQYTDRPAWAYLDANGYPAAPTTATTFNKLIYQRSPLNTPQSIYGVAAGDDLSLEPFTIEFPGSDWVPWVTGGHSLTMVTSTKYTFIADQDVTAITVGFTPGSGSTPPDKRLNIYQSRYATNVTNGEIFNPHHVIEWAKYGRLRTGAGFQRINDMVITDFSQLADEDYTNWGAPYSGASSSYGPKGEVHPSILCKLAIASGVREIHVNIPYMATDAFVATFAAYFRDHPGIIAAGIKVVFEWSNENWNTQFAQWLYTYNQGILVFPSDGYNAASKWAGYRAAAVMKIIRDTYGTPNRARWRGVLAAFTVDPTFTDFMYNGIDQYFSDNSLSIVTADLFNELDVTSYFGDFINSRPISAITKANPAVASFNNYPVWSNGQEVRVAVNTPHDGMVEIDGLYATLGNITDATPGNPDDFAVTANLVGINSTAFTTFAASPENAYLVSAEWFRLIDESKQAHIDHPVTYPSNAKLFCIVVAQAMLTGTATSPNGVTITVGTSVQALRQTIWPAQKLRADARGLDLGMYEGGYNLAGDVPLQGYFYVVGTNAQGDLFEEYLLQSGHSSEIAAVYRAVDMAFLRLGGRMPAKFTIDGQSSRSGTWPMIRSWPYAANGGVTDSNPVKTAIEDVNANPQPDTYTAAFTSA